MRDFWDSRAEEDAFYFVDNRLEYGAPDLESFWRGGRQDLDNLLGQLDLAVEADDQVVEIGCGVGRITRILAERAADVRALDVSERMLDLANEHHPELGNVTWVLGDGISLEGIPDESADVCFSHVVFQHIPDPDVTMSYVREMGRVLRTGGWAAFQVSNQPAVHHRRPVAERISAFAARLCGRGPRGQAHEAWLGSAVDLDRLAEAVCEGGCEIERIEGRATQWCLVRLRKRNA